MLLLDTDVQFVKGVGPRRVSLLTSRGVRTVGDLLLRIPRAYQDRSTFASLASLSAGQDAAVRAKIYRSRSIQTRTRGRILEVILTDGTSFAYAKWFHGGSTSLSRGLSAGREIILFGRVDRDNYESKLVFFNPEFELLDEADPSQAASVNSLDVGRIVPIYEELGGMTSRQLRRIIAAALADLANPLDDPIPPEIRNEHGFPDLRTCLQCIHFPFAGDNIRDLNRRESPAHRRLIFEEFFLLELVFALRKKQSQLTTGVRFETGDRVRSAVKKILPFHPTAAQKRVLREIVEDLKAPHPMSRLLQGDVGSGKTIVAFEAVVVAVENGYQAAIMAPTEILAEQHYLNARRVLAPLGYSIGVLRRGIKKAEKKKLFEALAEGSIQLVVGTHVLLEESTVFRKLGLVVIDEQHRFGVVQRLRLMSKGDQPNTLVMTATPIPRTLAMTLYGDLDLSVIDEMPPGRSPIKTIHETERNADRVYSRLAEEMGKGKQCYVVYPVIEESEKVDLKSATEGFEKLSKIFSGRAVALLHGRLKSDEKEAIMRDFAAGKLDVLVSTTVIEVGVDVANATVMIIEHAERFGLAQLHQLRGRVGRGSAASLCVLMTPDKIGETARERIDAMVSTTDGFRLAEVDLRLRGPGEMAGTRQSGLPEFRVANLMEDSLLLSLAQNEAKKFVESEEQALRLLKELSSRSSSIAPAGLVTVG
jgi:ATP-dependent DNA helicase RecG